MDELSTILESPKAEQLATGFLRRAGSAHAVPDRADARVHDVSGQSPQEI